MVRVRALLAGLALAVASVSLVMGDCASGSQMQILSDVDDTIFAGGSAANTDTTIPIHTLYDNVMAFFLGISEGMGKNAVFKGNRPNGPILLSARPVESLVVKLRESVSSGRAGALGDAFHFSEIPSDARAHDPVNGDWDLDGVLYGRVGDLFGRQSARNVAFGKTKFDNFVDFAVKKGGQAHSRFYSFSNNKYPGPQLDRCYVFVGDDGQGDEAAGVRMLREYGPPDVRDPSKKDNPYLVKAVFIHNISALNRKKGGYFSIRNDPLCVDYGSVLPYLHYFDTYYGAAAIAYRNNLMSMLSAARIVDRPPSACASLDNIRGRNMFPSSKKKKKERGFIDLLRLCQMGAADYESLVTEMRNDLTASSVNSKSVRFDPNILKLLRGTQTKAPQYADTSHKLAVNALFGHGIIQNHEPFSTPTHEDVFGDGGEYAWENQYMRTIWAVTKVEEFMESSKVTTVESFQWLMISRNIIIDGFRHGFYADTQLVTIRNNLKGCMLDFEETNVLGKLKLNECVNEVVADDIIPVYRDGLNRNEVPNSPQRYAAMTTAGDEMSILHRFVEDANRVISHFKNLMYARLHYTGLDAHILEKLAATPKEEQAAECMKRLDGNIPVETPDMEVSEGIWSEEDAEEFHSALSEPADSSMSSDEDEFPEEDDFDDAEESFDDEIFKPKGRGLYRWKSSRNVMAGHATDAARR